MFSETHASLIGNRAPNFLARSTHGDIALEDYEGSWVLLFCHPADFTPVCTTEFIELTERKTEFDALGVALMGLSVDSIYSHINWVEFIENQYGSKINFPIIEDISMEIAKAYQMIDQTRTSTATVRACIFIDPEQMVQAIIHYPMHVGRSVEEILRVQAALIETYNNDKATPVNWQPGDACMDISSLNITASPKGWLARTIDERK